MSRSAPRPTLIQTRISCVTDLSTHMTYASSPVPAASPAVENVFLKMLPITLAVFVGFLIIGLVLPVLPLHLHYTLGMSPVVVGIVIGGQFVTALLSRPW